LELGGSKFEPKTHQFQTQEPQATAHSHLQLRLLIANFRSKT